MYTTRHTAVAHSFVDCEWQTIQCQYIITAMYVHGATALVDQHLLILEAPL